MGRYGQGLEGLNLFHLEIGLSVLLAPLLSGTIGDCAHLEG